MKNKSFYLIAHNIRSLYNVGTMFRTADALGVDQLFLTGYTGQPPRKEISKVALGAEDVVPWKHYKSTTHLIKKLKKEGVEIIALERNDQSIDYLDFKPKYSIICLIYKSNEVHYIGMDHCYPANQPPPVPKSDPLYELGFYEVVNPIIDETLVLNPAHELWREELHENLKLWKNLRIINHSGYGAIFGRQIDWQPISDLKSWDEAYLPVVKQE